MAHYNIRTQILNLLKETGYPVYMEYPVNELTLPRLIYQQVAQAQLGLSTKRVMYQVDCYAETFEEVLEMEGEVIEKMESLKFRPTYESPDATARVDTKLYHKVLSFEGTIDTIYNRLL